MTASFNAAARREIDLGAGVKRSYYSLRALEAQGIGRISRLPVSIRIVLESLLRNCDGKRVTESHVRALANWTPDGKREEEIPFTVGRVVLNCAAGIPLLGDLTAIRGAVKRMGLPADKVGPRVPVDMALDHTLTVDFHGTPDALAQNMKLEISRNQERFRFVKWAMQAYDGIRLMPPGWGILHQLNLEFLAPGYLERDGVVYPDSLVGTDSHTCMIAGLGTVGWGVGGIEAEASMLGEPIPMLIPRVVGFRLTGKLPEGATATDAVLTCTQMLRKHKVVGKFVEFYGSGISSLSLTDRATIANMAPEYGATVGFFPVDDETLAYLKLSGRDEKHIALVEAYSKAQGLWRDDANEPVFSEKLDLDLGTVVPSIAGPDKPEKRIPLKESKKTYAKDIAEMVPAAKDKAPNGIAVDGRAEASTIACGTAPS